MGKPSIVPKDEVQPDPMAENIRDLALAARLLAEALVRVHPGDLTEVARNSVVERCRRIELRLEQS